MPMLYKIRKANIKGISNSGGALSISFLNLRRWISMRSQMAWDSLSALARLPGIEGYKQEEKNISLRMYSALRLSFLQMKELYRCEQAIRRLSNQRAIDKHQSLV